MRAQALAHPGTAVHAQPKTDFTDAGSAAHARPGCAKYVIVNGIRRCANPTRGRQQSNWLSETLIAGTVLLVLLRLVFGPVGMLKDRTFSRMQTRSELLPTQDPDEIKAERGGSNCIEDEDVGRGSDLLAAVAGLSGLAMGGIPRHELSSPEQTEGEDEWKNTRSI